MEQIIDNYLEHEQHIVGETGKRVPFFRNEKTCSTCYTERKKILDKSRIYKNRGYNNITRNPEYSGYEN